jgi:hypothetical protein
MATSSQDSECLQHLRRSLSYIKLVGKIVHTASISLRYRIILINLDFDTALGRELGDNDRVCNLTEDRLVRLATQSIVKGM